MMTERRFPPPWSVEEFDTHQAHRISCLGWGNVERTYHGARRQRRHSCGRARCLHYRWGGLRRNPEFWAIAPAPCETKRLSSIYRRGRSPLWLKVKNPNAPALRREAEEDWGNKRSSNGVKPPMSLRERTRPVLGIIEPCTYRTKQNPLS